MSIREARKEQTIRNILDAAAREFAETGFEGARMDHIADRAGANKAMIYYHIGDKQVLYTRILHEVLGHTASRMADDIQSAGTPREKLRAYIRSIDRTMTRHPFMPRIMMREMASGGRDLPDIVVHDFAAIIGLISSVIQLGVRSGEFVDVDPLALHLMVIGGLSYGRAAVPVMSRFPEQVAALTGDNGAVKMPDLLNKIETIVLSALTGHLHKDVP